MVSNPLGNPEDPQNPANKPCRMNRRKADFKFVYKYLEDEL